MFYGLLNLPWWGYLIAALVLTHITTIAVTLFLHRNQAHRALELHPVVSYFFRFWLWLTTAIDTKQWVAIHRKHHARCETEEDPHSPQILGLQKVLWFGAELYRKEAHNQETIERYGAGTPEDWTEINVYRRHNVKGILTMFIIDLILFGVPGIAIWGFQMMWSPLAAAGVINGVGHYFGYRNFETSDQARNVLPIGFLLGGEELHNNHHTYGTSAKFSVRWFEYDAGWMYIKLLSLFGLAKPRRVPPEAHLVPGKNELDVDTVKALFINRFQVMSRYAREVITPVLHMEQKQHVSAVLKDLGSRAKQLLIRETSLVDAKGKQWIEKILEAHPSIDVVYQFRQRLQAIWTQTTASHKELVDALQKWCHEAEATGITVLKKFAGTLRQYTMS